MAEPCHRWQCCCCGAVTLEDGRRDGPWSEPGPVTAFVERDGRRIAVSHGICPACFPREMLRGHVELAMLRASRRLDGIGA